MQQYTLRSPRVRVPFSLRYSQYFIILIRNPIIVDSLPCATIIGEFFYGDFTELFPDLLELPDTTVAMHQSRDGSMYWIAGKDGKLVRVGTSFKIL